LTEARLVDNAQTDNNNLLTLAADLDFQRDRRVSK